MIDLMTNDDSEITNISCKSANILYLRAKNRLRTSKRTEQSRRR